jgi:hypothetical protein
MKLFHLTFALATAPVWLVWGMIYKLCFNRNQNPWVISGHRGRIQADNARALFDYITTRTGQEIRWIGDGAEDNRYRLSRNSFASRLRLISAPVVIYSHGEDDVDICGRFFRPALGCRIYIGHGANLLKLTQLYFAGRKVDKPWVPLGQWLFGLDYDFLLAMNELEKASWDKVFPGRAKRHLAYGGAARLDYILKLSSEKPDKQIVWLPTFRESQEAENKLYDQIFATISDQRLIDWLSTNGYTLLVGNHINATDLASTSPVASPFVRFVRPEQWIEAASRSELLISDYSSILIDWLLFDRPAIFASFDLSSYSKVRGFHESYSHYVYGPQSMDTEELIDVICTGKWKQQDRHLRRRQELRREIFGELADNQTELTYHAICDLLTSPKHIPPVRKTTSDPPATSAD